jgi:shikimate dehydrogenase
MPDPTSPITLCGSLSLHPVTLGAAMHQAGYAALGLPWVYVPFGVTAGALPAALDGMRALGIRGLGVSMPFKIDVLPLLDGLDDLAARIGAANTIVNDQGKLTGHNTDARGASEALAEVVGSLEGCRCLVLGAGGAARAVAFGLDARGAIVTIANRSQDRARSLAADLGVDSLPWSEIAGDSTRFDALINATSAGMDQGAGPGDSPLADEPSGLRPGLVVMDIVYRPIRTRLIERAEARGARVIHGGRMLLYQAAQQFELYTGRDAPLEGMDQALVRAMSGA